MSYTIYWEKGTVLLNCLSEAAASQINPVHFILFLCSDYCWEIFNILIKLTKYRTIKSWMIWSHIVKLSPSRLFKQDTEGRSISRHIQTGVWFSIWFGTLKLIAIEIIGQWILHHLGLWSFKRNMHMSSTILHAAFNRAFKWMADIWSMYSRASLDIFCLCLRLNSCRS